VEARALREDAVHTILNARVGRARVALAEGRFEEAVATTARSGPHMPSPTMQGEYTAVHALALACAGDTQRARQKVSAARATSRAVETETSALCAIAVARIRDNAPADDEVNNLVSHLKSTCHFDAFVCAYRACPELLARSAREPATHEMLDGLLQLASDEDLSSRLPMPLSFLRSAAVAGLTTRESEVLELIRQGLSNVEIGTSLFISPATVKVHVRHIFEKLGVRSRTQAALRAVQNEFKPRSEP
jgi:DNA-binding CsgD family transcriptional regulator